MARLGAQAGVPEAGQPVPGGGLGVVQLRHGPAGAALRRDLPHTAAEPLLKVPGAQVREYFFFSKLQNICNFQKEE